MSRRRTLTLASAMACGLAGILGIGASPEIRTFPVQSGDTLVIQNDYGRVRIGSADGSALEVRIDRHSGSQAAAQVSVFAEKRADRIFIYCFFDESPSESVDLEVRAPAFMNVALWGANPEVEVRGLQGTVHIHSWTGGIAAENLTGPVVLMSERGDVAFRSDRQPKGDVHLETSNGTIYCELDEMVNARTWFRAGGSVLVGDEPQGDMLEKQFGTGGPLIYAGSLKGSVRVAMKSRTKPASVGIPPSELPESPAEESSPRLAELPRARPERAPADAEAPAPEAPRRTDSPELQSTPPLEVQPSIGSEGSPVFKVAVDWVFLNASVRDRYSNRSIPDLEQDDFEVYEDGVLQEIGQFENAEAPFHLLLLLDTSGSTRSFMDLSKEASIQFTHEIKSNDRIGAVAFNSDVTFIQDFTSDRNEVARSIRRLKSGGGTAFYDALLECVDNYMRGIQGRKAIVVFTDGVDNQLSGNRRDGSRTSFEELFRRIQEIDTIIYPIFLDTEDRSFTGVPSSGRIGDILGGIIWGRRVPGRYPNPSPGAGNRAAYREAERQLQFIADQTGGRMYAPRQIGDLSRVYTEIADDLRVQYWLGYTSSNRNMDGKWRQISVRVKNHPNAAVRTRKGYYARTEASGSAKRAGA